MLIKDKKKINEYYKALVDREPSYVGIFYVGVKTTSIFCIATCHARKPKIENVEFYTSSKEALEAGYRPCKICKPTENANQAPAPVEAALELIENNPKEKISDDQLRRHNISPELVRRWFRKNYGMTFHAYQRMHRMKNAFTEVKDGKKTTDIAFDTGYDSLSGFGYAYKKFVGHSPKKSVNGTVILISRFTTPLGPMFACATNEGICLLEFVDRKILEKEFTDLQNLLKANIIAGENIHIQQVKQEMAEYFDGKRKHFDVKLHMPGTAFQQNVWHSLINIPYGARSTYQQQANVINKPRAVRAMAAANGANRIAVIVPCHRVIAKDGKLTGYGGGLERKQWLLEHELKHS